MQPAHRPGQPWPERRHAGTRFSRPSRTAKKLSSGKPTTELQLILRLLDAVGLGLSLDERDAPTRESQPAAPAGVDLDALLGEYRER